MAILLIAGTFRFLPPLGWLLLRLIWMSSSSEWFPAELMPTIYYESGKFDAHLILSKMPKNMGYENDTVWSSYASGLNLT